MVIEVVAQRWCILRTSATHTLRLAGSLTAAGIEAWTPRRTIKRPALGNRRRYVIGQRRVMVEVDLPILPGFVFARAEQLDDVIRAGALPFGPHASFSLLQVGDRIPLVGERHVAGLREAEHAAETAIAAERDAETRDEERRARAARLGTERARRKALRQEHRHFDDGQHVAVDGMSALTGSIGTIVESRGTTAVIHFGGMMTIEVEAWRIRPAIVQSGNTLDREAA